MESEQEKQHRPEIEALISIAFEKGIKAALKEAESRNDPHILDDFHDALISTLKNRPEMLNRIK